MIKTIFRIFAWLCFLALSCCGVMAIVYSNLPSWQRIAGAAVFELAALGSGLFPERGWRKMAWFAAVFAVVLGWWLRLVPENDRDWPPDLEKLPYADIAGSSVTIHNIRNCNYQAADEYTVRHYDRTFDLASLRTMDLFLADWGAPNIAHPMLSFGFGGDKYICFSIEARRKKEESYSYIKGFFRQYELTYVAADERDLIRLRTNYRKDENVYLYRLSADREIMRKIFLDYLSTMNRLKDSPQWYSALTTSCAAHIRKIIVTYYPKFRYDWRLLANGHVDELAYEMKALDQSAPFPALRKSSLINERSKAAKKDPAYSAIIRRGLPGFD